VLRKIYRSGVGVADVERLFAGERLHEIGEGAEVGVRAVEDEVADAVDFAVVGEPHFAGDGAGVGVGIRHAVLHLDLLQAFRAVDDAPAVDHHWRARLLSAHPPRHPQVQRSLNHLLRTAVSRCLLPAAILRRRRLISCQQLVEFLDARALSFQLAACSKVAELRPAVVVDEEGRVFLDAGLDGQLHNVEGVLVFY